ncbi:Tlg2 protein [Martiniozyma asiatica (nom. inval.)]|nr:Tlg2 protein [Martiniozyma asiatica]
MFRDRTNLFKSYRDTFPHRKIDNQFDLGPSLEEGGDIEMQQFTKGYQKLNVDSAPLTNYTESIIAIETKGNQLSQKIKSNLNLLDKKYRDILLPTFDDDFIKREMNGIDKLSGTVMLEIQSLYKVINQLQELEKSLKVAEGTQLRYHDDNSNPNPTRSLINNLKRKFAIDAQELTGEFRDKQSRYIRYLKKGQDETDSSALFETDVESYSRNAMLESSKQIQIQANHCSDEYLLQREREIYKISQSVVEISTIFKELENIVIDQGTILDNIAYNLDKTHDHVKGAEKELIKAEGYQKQTGKCKLVMFLVLLIILVAFLFLVKPRRDTKVVYAPPAVETEPTLDESASIKPLSPIENIRNYKDSLL